MSRGSIRGIPRQPYLLSSDKASPPSPPGPPSARHKVVLVEEFERSIKINEDVHDPIDNILLEETIEIHVKMKRGFHGVKISHWGLK